ncbi:hypothetical protein SLE2022_309000 [Rubroshorea leprosula]
MPNIPRVGTTSSQACAACKYQRRKCTPDCILAPYFPHHRQRQFLNAHKLFGVSNITKIIKNLNLPDKETAMRTIMFQSDARANDPVGGCYRIICELHRQIECSKAELELVLHQLAIYRAYAARQQPHDVKVEETAVSDSAIGSKEVVDLDTFYNFYELVQEQSTHVQEQSTHVQEDHVDTWSGEDCSKTSTSFHVKQISFGDECDDVKLVLEMNKFEAEDIVEQRFVPSAELLLSS